MAERYLGVVSPGFQLQDDGRRDTPGAFGNSSELDATRAINSQKAPVMRPNPAFVLDREVKQPIDDQVQDDALPRHATVPRGSSESSQTSNTFSAGAGIVRVTAMLARFMVGSPVLHFPW